MKKNIIFLLTIILCSLPFCSIKAAIAITPPDHFVGDGTLNSGTPSLIEEPTIPTSSTQNPTPIITASVESIADKVEINTASLEQLDEITGIGPVLAQRITDARPFSSIDDLLRVKGIGEKILQKIKDQGLAYIEGQTQQPAQQTNQTKNPQVQNTDTANLTPNTQNPTPTAINYPSGIVFSEIMPSPEGPDETEEYIKIFNQNNFEVDISNWQIKDKRGKITTYTFPQETKIPALGYLVLKRPETKITLNNDGDELELINPNEEVADSVIFEKAPQNQPYIKTSEGWVWKKEKLAEDEPRLADKNKVAEKQTAAIINNIDLSTQKSRTPFLLIALVVSAISVIIIFLIIKKHFTKTSQ